MSAVETKPVTETPAAPVVDAPAATETPAVSEPAVAETAPVEPAVPAKTEETAEPVAAVEEAKKEEKAPVEPKYDGALAYNAPSNFLKELLPLPPKKQYFWFGTEPVASQELNHYLAKGKEAAHSTAAWASQTGTGLLYFTKHGEKKDSPTGVLNLADAEDIKSSGTQDISFKLHGHKHKFEAAGKAERDSWLAAFTKVAEEAKAKKEEIVNSEGYKEALAKLKPAAAVIAPVSVAKATEATPKKSTEAKSSSETPAEAAAEESKKTSKSRSRSRGAPSSIVGFFKNKKDEVKPESKKEEPVAAETAATEPAATEPVAETTTAPVITDAVPPVEEKKVEETKKDDVKAGRRQSRFESFFSTKPKTEKVAEPKETKEPAVEPISDNPPTIEEPSAAAVAPIDPVVETPVEAAEKKEGEATTPTKERKPSLLAGVKSFTQKLRSPSSEAPPALAETPVTTAAAETTEAPAAAATETPAVAAATEPTTEAPATNGDSKALPAAPTDIKEKRRSSFFSADFIKGKLPKTEKKVEPTTSAEEPVAKTEEATEEVAKPVEETAAVAAEPEKKSTEVKPTEPKAEKEHKESPITSLGRRVSKAFRGDKKRDVKPVPKVEESSETAPQIPKPETEEPAIKAPETEKEKAAPTSIGDVVPEAVNVGTAPAPSATVTASA